MSDEPDAAARRRRPRSPACGWSVASPCGSVVAHTADALAEAPLTPDRNGTWEVVQRGRRRLWDTIEHAVTAFEALGRPDRSRYGGVTALDDPGSQYVWLDDPQGAHSFPLLARWQE